MVMSKKIKKLTKKQLLDMERSFKDLVKIGKITKDQFNDGMIKIVNSELSPTIPKKHKLYKWITN